MSGGQIALRELGVKYGKYYASEVDRFAIAQTQLNFPDTVQLGDVTAWRTWTLDWGEVDLILAGSPCQGFSRCGKGLAFDDPRSRLFFEFVDILHHARRYNPGVVFLLENVPMKKAWMRVISEAVGVMPVRIDSGLVSAQVRNRCYWSNIRTRREGLFGELQTDIPQPPDRGILLKDIAEDNAPPKYYLSLDALNRLRRAQGKGYAPKLNPRKAGTLTLGNNSSKLSFDAGTTFISVEGKARTLRGYTGGASLDGKHNYNIIQLNPSTESNGKQPYQQNRVYSVEGKSPAHMAELCCGSYAILQRGRGFNNGGVKEGKSPPLTAHSWENNNHLLCDDVRRLTPTECARLQTVPDWYKWACSDTQQYKLLGNGWTIEVIKHILSYGKYEV
jgi:DNA (cytosine-5)-methyltransferase 3A